MNSNHIDEIRNMIYTFISELEGGSKLCYMSSVFMLAITLVRSISLKVGVDLLFVRKFQIPIQKNLVFM